VALGNYPTAEPDKRAERFTVTGLGKPLAEVMKEVHHAGTG
jgi:hypothetical protein